MRARIVLASILIAVGIVALVYQGITYKTQETALDLGRLQVTTQRTRTLPIPPIVGAMALLGGITLLVLGKSRSTEAVIVGRK